MDSSWTSGFLKKAKPCDSKAGKRDSGPERKNEYG